MRAPPALYRTLAGTRPWPRRMDQCVISPTRKTLVQQLPQSSQRRLDPRLVFKQQGLIAGIKLDNGRGALWPVACPAKDWVTGLRVCGKRAASAYARGASLCQNGGRCCASQPMAGPSELCVR